MNRLCRLCDNAATYVGDDHNGDRIEVCGLHSTTADRRIPTDR